MFRVEKNPRLLTVNQFTVAEASRTVFLVIHNSHVDESVPSLRHPGQSRHKHSGQYTVSLQGSNASQFQVIATHPPACWDQPTSTFSFQAESRTTPATGGMAKMSRDVGLSDMRRDTGLVILRFANGSSLWPIRYHTFTLNLTQSAIWPLGGRTRQVSYHVYAIDERSYTDPWQPHRLVVKLLGRAVKDMKLGSRPRRQFHLIESSWHGYSLEISSTTHDEPSDMVTDLEVEMATGNHRRLINWCQIAVFIYPA